MAVRALVLALCIGALGCGDDTTRPLDLGVNNHPNDLSVAANDASSCGGTFSGFSPGERLTFIDCSCGCSVDTFMHADISPQWAVSRTGATQSVGTNNGLQSILQVSPAEPISVVGLLSQTVIDGFFLDGDFDLLVDYSFGGVAPPGESHLILGVREPVNNVGTEIYDLERAHLLDGSDVYRSQLGGVPAQDTPTSAVEGTLELQRKGLVTTAIADGNKVGQFLAADGPRMEITLSSALSSCGDVDGGVCSYAPLWISMRLTSGTLVNQP